MKPNSQLFAFLESEDLSKDSLFYRYTLPEFIRRDENGKYFISANPEATEMIEDVYGNGHSKMAKFLSQGLAFTTAIEEEFKSDDHVLISLKVEKILDQEGLIYPDVSSYTSKSKAFYITIPTGEIEVEKIEE